uniref:Reverse transcriptase domain-containing protein n=1 Tax=Sparus aurata TaxID=8175 RepID=A0A671W1V6_SPAAU
MKNARVVPLFKKNSRADVGNYRPVSILSTISKIFERLVYEQVEEYLIRHDILYELQSGFRAAHSTDTCLIHLFDYVRQNLDQGNYVGMLLLDLQKAFDTVNHDILTSKLQCMGFSNLALKWFSSYLTDRTQVCDVEGTLSEPQSIVCGVPQGSILGPLLFLLYINDMSAVVHCKLLLYADDSALLVPGCNVSDIENTLGAELESVNQWLIVNKLSMHLGKTESILFGTKRKLVKSNVLKVMCNGSEIVSRSNVTYLGLTLDQSLTGESIAAKILDKCACKLKFLYRKTRFLDCTVKKLLAMTLIQCHIDFACSAWFSGLTVKLKNKFKVLQNNVIRYLLNAPPRTHIGREEFNKAGLLPVHLRVEQLKLNHMFNIVNGKAPNYLNANINMVHTQHKHNTRASIRSCIVPKVKNAGKHSFFYTGIMVWNGLPTATQLASSSGIFKGQVKQILWNKIF